MKSDNIQEIAKALAAAQLEMKPAVRNKKNPFFKSSYADLESVCDACLNILNKNGISVTQTTAPAVDGIILETTLLHTSGQWISSLYPVHPTKNDPQSLGSAFKYARRYALSGIACVSESDDDAEHAMDRDAPERLTKPSVAPERKKDYSAYAIETLASEKQIGELRDAIKKSNWSDDKVIEYLSGMGKKTLKELSWFQWKDMIEKVTKYPVLV